VGKIKRLVTFQERVINNKNDKMAVLKVVILKTAVGKFMNKYEGSNNLAKKHRQRLFRKQNMAEKSLMAITMLYELLLNVQVVQSAFP
jgi:uncharacterized membrane protein YqgA involved in biofilm formation